MFSEPRQVAYHEVYFETPNKKTGVMRKQLCSYIEPRELDSFLARIEKQKGRVIRIDAPRYVETSEV